MSSPPLSLDSSPSRTRSLHDPRYPFSPLRGGLLYSEWRMKSHLSDSSRGGGCQRLSEDSETILQSSSNRGWITIEIVAHTCFNNQQRPHSRAQSSPRKWTLMS